jgi:hypothetical protein
MSTHELETADSPNPGGLNLAEKIRRLANGRTTIDVAQFQFIGLETIRERYGRLWNERRAKVVHVASNFITKRIAPDDVMITGADGFLLIFGSRSGVLADAAAERLSTELNTFFLGAADIDDDIRLVAQHRAMSVDDFAEAFGDLIAESPGVASPAPLRFGPGEIPMGFTPVWDALRGVITTYFVTPLDAATGQPLEWDPDRHRHTDMDDLKLKASEDALKKLFASGKKALVGVAVHVSSLNNRQSLERLLATMARFDKKLAGYRVVRLSGVDPGFPRIYLEDIFRTVKARVPNIAIGFNWTEPDVGSVMRLRPAAVGFGFPPGTLGAPGPRADLFARIQAAADLSRLHAVPIGVEGDIDPEHAQRLAAEGAHLLASPRIWPVLPVLPPAQLWPASRLAGMVSQNAA